MTPEQMLSAARAAREFSMVIEGRTFRLVTPTHHESTVAVERSREANRVCWSVAQRAMLERAIIGWSGVTHGDILGSDGKALAPYSSALVSVLLDSQVLWAEQLQSALDDRLLERAQALDTARKNSQSALPGSVTEATPQP